MMAIVADMRRRGLVPTRVLAVEDGYDIEFAKDGLGAIVDVTSSGSAVVVYRREGGGHVVNAVPDAAATPGEVVSAVAEAIGAGSADRCRGDGLEPDTVLEYYEPGTIPGSDSRVRIPVRAAVAHERAKWAARTDEVDPRSFRVAALDFMAVHLAVPAGRIDNSGAMCYVYGAEDKPPITP